MQLSLIPGSRIPDQPSAPGARAFGVILFRRLGSVCEYLFVGPAYGLSSRL